MKKILILQASDICYNSLQFFSDELAQGFRSIGCEVIIDDPNNAENHFNQVDAVLAFNLRANVTLNDGSYLYDHFNVPIIDFIVDHPQVHHTSLRTPLQNFYVVCLDENHKKYIHNCYPHIKGVACSYLLGTAAEDISKPIIERSYDILMVGSYINEQVFLQHIEQNNDSLITQISYDLIDYVLDHRNSTLEDVLAKILETHHLPTTGSDFADISSMILPPIELFFRHYYRHLVMRSLIQEGLQVTACGNGWDNLSCANEPNIHFIDSVPFLESFKLMADAKIVLNVMPWFKSGFHDRIFSAFANRAIIATDTSTEINNLLTNKKDSILYSLDDINSLPTTVIDVLTDPALAQSIADTGHQHTADYTFPHIAHTILELIS